MGTLKTNALVAILMMSVSATFAADIATVNGQGISEAMLVENVKANVAQGQKDTPELRKMLTDELINRLLLVQSAESNGLTKTTEARVSVEQLKEN